MSMVKLPTPPVAPLTSTGPPIRALAVQLHPIDRQCGGEPRGADGHAVPEREPLGEPDQPVPRRAHVL